MIREFNLNELFQKSKKLNKSRGMKEEEQDNSQPEDGSNELYPDDNPEHPAESKKDQWDEEEGRMKSFHFFQQCHAIDSTTTKCHLCTVFTVANKYPKILDRISLIWLGTTQCGWSAAMKKD